MNQEVEAFVCIAGVGLGQRNGSEVVLLVGGRGVG